MRGLLRDSIDFERGQLRVHRQWCPTQNKLVDHTKTRQARTVPVPQAVLTALADMRTFSGDQLLFPFMCKAFGHKRLKQYMKMANVKVIRMHDFRHTFASQMLQQGAPLIEVKELLGHRKFESTIIYLHYMPDRNSGATDRLLSETPAWERQDNVISIAR